MSLFLGSRGGRWTPFGLRENNSSDLPPHSRNRSPSSGKNTVLHHINPSRTRHTGLAVASQAQPKYILAGRSDHRLGIHVLQAMPATNPSPSRPCRRGNWSFSWYPRTTRRLSGPQGGFQQDQSFPAASSQTVWLRHRTNAWHESFQGPYFSPLSTRIWGYGTLHSGGTNEGIHPTLHLTSFGRVLFCKEEGRRSPALYRLPRPEWGNC